MVQEKDETFSAFSYRKRAYIGTDSALQAGTEAETEESEEETKDTDPLKF